MGKILLSSCLLDPGGCGGEARCPLVHQGQGRCPALAASRALHAHVDPGGAHWGDGCHVHLHLLGGVVCHASQIRHDHWQSVRLSSVCSTGFHWNTHSPNFAQMFCSYRKFVDSILPIPDWE